MHVSDNMTREEVKIVMETTHNFYATLVQSRQQDIMPSTNMPSQATTIHASLFEMGCQEVQEKQTAGQESRRDTGTQ